MSKFKVNFQMDETYDVVVEKEGDEEYDINREVVFSGSLSDCEAYIRLNEGGYMN